ncbi:MAG: hypothetical protein MUF54_11000, partial [Polyangiaceae bacterium]|nr:hypothetical protein [Polyangiaceae bacterium]
FDGSPVQPGKDAPRPRGYREQDVIPAASRVAVPVSVSALAAAHAHDGALGLGEIVAPSVKIATAQRCKSRAALLRRVGQVGPIALRETGFSRAVFEVAGRQVEGNLTQTDLDEATAAVVPPRRAEGMLLPARPCSELEAPCVAAWVIAACDARGVFAVLHATYDPDGIELPAFEITAPRFAVPVRRGVPRVRPGVRLTMPAPMALLTEGEMPWAAVAFESTVALTLETLWIAPGDGLTFDQQLENLLRAERAHVRRAVAVVRGSGQRAAVRSLQWAADATP